MKKNIFKLSYITAILSVFLIVSCDAILEEDITDFGKGPVIVQFTKSSSTGAFLQDENEIVYTYDVPVAFNGGDNLPSTEAVTLTIAVSSESTATEGVEFTVAAKEITIPAGSNTAIVQIMVNSAVLDNENPKTAVLEIVSSSITPSNGKEKTTITLQATCPSNLAGEYDVDMIYIPVGGGATNLTGVDTIVATGDGTYRTQEVGHWEITDGPGAIGGTPGFDFSEVCGNIVIPEQNLVNLYSNLVAGVEGNSSVDSDTGVITIEYTICTDSGCRQYFVTYTPR